MSDRIRNMTDAQKMKYFLTKLANPGIPQSQKEDIIISVSELAKDVSLDEFLSKFELKGTFDKEHTPITLTVELDAGLTFTMVISDLERKDFKDAKPEAQKRPIKSFLTQEELDELNSHE